jgi:hypothetical protein
VTGGGSDRDAADRLRPVPPAERRVIPTSNGPDGQSTSLTVGGRLAGVLVRGVALGSANFIPATVPVLSRHRGLCIGYVQTLTADGPDLHFTARLSGCPDLRQASDAGWGISIEIVEGGERRAPIQRTGAAAQCQPSLLSRRPAARSEPRRGGADGQASGARVRVVGLSSDFGCAVNDE